MVVSQNAMLPDGYSRFSKKFNFIKSILSLEVKRTKIKRSPTEVRRMYPHRILVHEKGIKMLQPFDPRSADKL